MIIVGEPNIYIKRFCIWIVKFFNMDVTKIDFNKGRIEFGDRND